MLTLELGMAGGPVGAGPDTPPRQSLKDTTVPTIQRAKLIQLKLQGGKGGGTGEGGSSASMPCRGVCGRPTGQTWAGRACMTTKEAAATGAAAAAGDVVHHQGGKQLTGCDGTCLTHVLPGAALPHHPAINHDGSMCPCHLLPAASSRAPQLAHRMSRQELDPALPTCAPPCSLPPPSPSLQDSGLRMPLAPPRPA